MPNLIVAAFVKAVIFVSGVLATGGLPAFLLRTGFVALLSLASSKLFGPKAIDGPGILNMKVMTRSALEYRNVVYGQAMTSGPIFYNNLSGNNGQYLWYGIALAEGQSEDLVAVYLDGNAIPKADIDWVAGVGAADGTGTGDVSTAKYVGDNSQKAVSIFYYLGDDLQPACGAADTAFVNWTTNTRLRGVTYLFIRLLYNEDTESVWKSGPPSNISAVLKGRKLYDPRLDSTVVIDPTTSPVTMGSGSHRYATPSTWAWSDNPALANADYLFNVMDADEAVSINWPAVAKTADDCEVQVVIPPETSPETQENRFTCNGALSLGSTHKDNLDYILSSMDGKLAYSGGVWKVRASVWEASSVSIDADDLAGDVEIRGSSPKSERFSTVRGSFIDPTRDYEATEFPHITVAAYAARDNSEEIEYDLLLPMTNSSTMAQRIAYRNIEQADNQIVVKLKMNARGAKVAVGDVVDLTLDHLSWSAKLFRCIGWSRGDDGSFDVVLKEDDSSDYTDPLVGEYATPGTAVVTYPTDVVPPPSSLSAAGVAGGIKLTWTNPPSRGFEFIDIYEDTNDSWAGAVKIASVRADTYTVPHDSGTTYYYWIRAIRPPDQESLRDPNSDTTTISAAATAGVDGDDAVAVVYTNNNHSVPVTNLNVEDWTGSGGLAYVFEGTTLLTLASNSQSTSFPAISAGEYLIDITKVSGDTLTEPTITGTGTTTGTLGVWASNLTQVTVYRITFTIKTASAAEITIQQDITLSPSFEGADGGAGADGDDAFALNYTNNAHTPAVNNLGVEDWTGSGGLFYAYEGGTVLTLATNTQTASWAGLSASEYNLNITKISGDTLTEPSITGQTTTTATLGVWASDLTQTTVYRITAYILSAASVQISLSTDVTISPADQGADGSDGIPGLPGASYLADYANADTDGSSSSAGRYHLMTSITNTTGTLDWATWVTASGVDYFSVFKTGTSGTIDHSLFYDQTAIGDVVTIWNSTRKWVSFRITSLETAPTDMYKWGITLISFDEADGTGNLDVDAVVHRWSRSYTDVVTISDYGITIASDTDAVTNAEAAIQVNTDGTVKIRQGLGAAFTTNGTWLGTGTNADFECMYQENPGGASDPTGSAVNTWLVCSTTRTWTLLASQPSELLEWTGILRFRRVSDNTVLASEAASIDAEAV